LIISVAFGEPREMFKVNPKADYILDFRTTFSPLCLLKVTRVFREMKPQQVMEILGCDPDTRKDLFKLLPQADFDIVTSDSGRDKDDFCRLRLKKCSSTV
jgi:TusA-related sulfurtransferase